MSKNETLTIQNKRIAELQSKRKAMFGAGNKFGMDLRPAMRLNIPVGAGFDLLNAEIIIGMKGEYLVNGGLSHSTSIAGAGNTFKSTLLEFLSLSAMNKIMSTHDSYKHKYDTENNISLNGLERFTEQFEYLPENMILGEDARWTITNKATIYAGEWLDQIRVELMNKSTSKDMQIEFNAFKDYRTGGVLKLPVPTFYDIDSLSELEGSASAEMVEEKGIDGSETAFMKQGALKTKLLSILTNLSIKTNTYIGLTAQIGQKVSMDTMADKYSPPPKSSTYINQNTKVKSVSDKFFFLPLTSLIVKKSSPLVNQATKTVEFPMSSENELSTDLHVLDVVPYRNKSGVSGQILKVVVSQKDGVLPALTDFYNCKENKFGIEGSNTSYNFIIYPDVKMGRTTVRRKLDDDRRLARAAEITHNLLQTKYMRYVIDNDLYCEPDVLYKDIKDLGYNWETLLDTRGWYAPDNYAEYLLPYLSIVDLLYIRKGKVPFWYDKSTLKNKKEK